MANQKVKDLATVQTPKDTDYIMLLTDLSNNVVEKIELNNLSEIFRTNEISEDIRNALKLGTDDKLYVSDLSEDIEQVTNDLSSLTLDVEDISQEIEGIQQTISTFDSMIPDYVNREERTVETTYIAEVNGYVQFTKPTYAFAGGFLYIDDILVCGNSAITNATLSTTFIAPVAKGSSYKVSGNANNMYFIPTKGV